jgi:hypothetical protein
MSPLQYSKGVAAYPKLVGWYVTEEKVGTDLHNVGITGAFHIGLNNAASSEDHLKVVKYDSLLVI